MTTLKDADYYQPVTFYADSHPIHLEPSPRWVRVYFEGVAVADSRNVLLMREHKHMPVYYFPMEDVRTDLLTSTDHSTHCPYKGDAKYWSVEVNDRSAENAVWSYPEPIENAPDLSNYAAFYWNKMDHWFEEDEEVYVHPRDPYKRVDVLPSSRRIRVDIEGETVAESDRPSLLLETGLPVRYYLPLQDVRMEMLTSSDTVTRCPYKGRARYYSVQIGDQLVEDIAWYYRYPTLEAAGIEGRICFYNEKVDIFVDGEQQPRPDSPFS